MLLRCFLSLCSVYVFVCKTTCSLPQSPISLVSFSNTFCKTILFALLRDPSRKKGRLIKNSIKFYCRRKECLIIFFFTLRCFSLSLRVSHFLQFPYKYLIIGTFSVSYYRHFFHVFLVWPIMASLRWQYTHRNGQRFSKGTQRAVRSRHWAKIKSIVLLFGIFGRFLCSIFTFFTNFFFDIYPVASYPWACVLNGLLSSDHRLSIYINFFFAFFCCRFDVVQSRALIVVITSL